MCLSTLLVMARLTPSNTSCWTRIRLKKLSSQSRSTWGPCQHELAKAHVASLLFTISAELKQLSSFSSEIKKENSKKQRNWEYKKMRRNSLLVMRSSPTIIRKIPKRWILLKSLVEVAKSNLMSQRVTCFNSSQQFQTLVSKQNLSCARAFSLIWLECLRIHVVKYLYRETLRTSTVTTSLQQRSSVEFPFTFPSDLS